MALNPGNVDMKGWVAIITGGASGLGEAATREVIDVGAAFPPLGYSTDPSIPENKLARVGVNCVIFDMNEDRAKEICEELNSKGNSRHTFVSGDVVSEADVENSIEAARKLGHLRLVVNSAGVGAAWRVVDRKGKAMPLEVFSRPININLIGTFNVARLAAAEMVRNTPVTPDGQRGCIVNVASVAAFDGQIGQAGYSASKGGVVGMTLPMARDLAEHGIRINTIAPGTFDTPLLAALPDEIKNGLAADIPNPHRLGNPHEFGCLVRHICENTYINGETIRLDGALRMPPKSNNPPRPPAKL